MPQAVAEVLDHWERYQAPLTSLMKERFHLRPRVEVVAVDQHNNIAGLRLASCQKRGTSC